MANTKELKEMLVEVRNDSLRMCDKVGKILQMLDVLDENDDICEIPDFKFLEPCPKKEEVPFPTEVPDKRPLKSDADIEVRITEILHELGIPAHINGYTFLRTAIKMGVKDSNVMQGVTKKLYPDVAKEHKTTPSRVERAIRHAIEVGCERAHLEEFNNMFGYTISAAKGKPTNSEYIAMIADKVKLELMR